MSLFKTNRITPLSRDAVLSPAKSAETEASSGKFAGRSVGGIKGIFASSKYVINQENVISRYRTQIGVAMMASGCAIGIAGVVAGPATGCISAVVGTVVASPLVLGGAMLIWSDYRRNNAFYN